MGGLGKTMFTPRQTPTQYQQTDPFRNLKDQQGYTEGLLRGATTGSHVGGIGGISVPQGRDPVNPFVGAGPQQQRALGQLENWYGEATPAFSTGVGQIERTAGGGYLDPMARPEFSRLGDARLNLARQMFADFAPQYSGAAGARGVPFRSSSREEGVQRGAERIGTQAAQDIAQAGWGQYGAERGLQEQAARAGAALAPGLAQQVFAGGEQLRGAEQAGGTAQMQAQTQLDQARMQAAVQAQAEQMRGQLAAMGLDQRAIENVLNYMKIASGEPLKHIPGKSPYQEWMGVIGDVGKMYTGGIGGMGSVGGLGS